MSEMKTPLDIIESVIFCHYDGDKPEHNIEIELAKRIVRALHEADFLSEHAYWVMNENEQVKSA